MYLFNRKVRAINLAKPKMEVSHAGSTTYMQQHDPKKKPNKPGEGINLLSPFLDVTHDKGKTKIRKFGARTGIIAGMFKGAKHTKPTYWHPYHVKFNPKNYAYEVLSQSGKVMHMTKNKEEAIKIRKKLNNKMNLKTLGAAAVGGALPAAGYALGRAYQKYVHK